MKIQLVSFPVKRFTNKERQNRVDFITRKINDSDADFIMFSEHVLNNRDDLFLIGKRVKNRHISALFEIPESKNIKGNRLYLLKNNHIEDLETHQIFATSSDATKKNVELLIDELEAHRQFKIFGKSFLVIQCGENNILKGNSGIARFRLEKREDFKLRFSELLDNTDVVLNPVHTPWKRFGCYLSRLRSFSDSGRYCFSCTQLSGNQLENAKKKPEHNITQVAMHNTKRIAPLVTYEESHCFIQTYVI